MKSKKPGPQELSQLMRTKHISERNMILNTKKQFEKLVTGLS